MEQKSNYPNAANLNAETDFPFFVRSAENRSFSKGDVDFGVMHWHEDLQIIYVLEGNVCVKTLEDEVILSAGEGVLTNKGVIHYSIFRSLPCRYRLFRFPERFVSFYPGSPAERQVRAITENSGISLVTFKPEVPWCAEVLRHLQNLVQLDDNKDDNPFFSYDILTELTQIWQIMQYNIKVPERLPQNTVSIRMRHFLEYIEAHYAEEISLEGLAASAGVSKTEAMRCFRKSLQTTP